MANQDPNSWLPADTSAKYEVVDWVGSHRQIFGRFGVIDLKNLSPRQAGSLVKRGFSKLREKTEQKSTGGKAEK